MNLTESEQAALIKQRRKEAMLEIAFTTLARAGLPIAGAYLATK